MTEFKPKTAGNPNGLERLYQEFGEVKGTLTQVEVRLSSLENRMIDMNNSIKTIVRDNESRIINTEKKIAWIEGRSAGIAAIVSLIISTLGLLLAYLTYFR